MQAFKVFFETEAQVNEHFGRPETREKLNEKPREACEGKETEERPGFRLI